MKTTSIASWAGAIAMSTLLFSCGGTKDADIEKMLKEKAASSQYLSGKSFSVSNGAVTITGECPDETCKTGAESEAKTVSGVKSVVNNITVPAPMTQAPVPMSTDTAMVMSDDNTLMSGLRDATKDFPTVQYSVSGGVVTLSGTVNRRDLPTIMQRVNALQPKKVANNLTVK